LSLLRFDAPRPKRGVLAFGEVLWDQMPAGAMLGGAPTNFACLVQSLGMPTVLVSRVGADMLGDQAVAELARRGLRTDCIQRDAARPTGTVSVAFGPGGQPSYDITAKVAYDRVEAAPAALRSAEECELLYFGTLAQREPQARAALAQLVEAAPAAAKFLDVNLRRGCYTAETVQTSLAQCDMVKLNEAEVFEIADLLRLGTSTIEGFCAAVMARFAIELCLVTCGPEGVLAQARAGEVQRVPGYAVTVNDSVGAGDAFTAGFVWSHLQGVSLRESCEVGVRCGALATMHAGALTAIRPDELTRFPFASWHVQEGFGARA
jgi:fructokinase